MEADIITLTEGSTDAPTGPTAYGRSGEENNRRKPKPLAVREGESTSRFAERAYPGLPKQEPPSAVLHSNLRMTD